MAPAVAAASKGQRASTPLGTSAPKATITVEPGSTRPTTGVDSAAPGQQNCCVGKMRMGGYESGYKRSKVQQHTEVPAQCRWPFDPTGVLPRTVDAPAAVPVDRIINSISMNLSSRLCGHGGHGLRANRKGTARFCQ